MLFKTLKSVLVALVVTATAGAGTISSDTFSVKLNPAFPGVLSYSFQEHDVTLPVGDSKVVLLNDSPFTPQITFSSVSEQTAEYTMSFADIGVTLVMSVEVSPEAMTMTITDILETSGFMVRTIEIPGLVLLAGNAQQDAALANFPRSGYASEKPEDHDIFATVADITPERIKSKNGRKDSGVSYAFLSNGKIAAGLYSNVLDENLRMIVTFRGEGEDKMIAVAPGKWLWREVPFLTTLDPQVKLIVAVDNNGDGTATWQDAAIAYRRNTPKAYGAGRLKKYPIGHIAMNFGSQATNPFLRVLDNAKKVWLYTDGLGQHIQFKGYQSEGHDSSHPDYGGNVGRRQGGRDDLNFVMRRGRDFGVLSGVHINAQEYHPEAKNFSWDIADKDRIGWSWLDASYRSDYRYDSAYGTLYPRLEAMRKDLPWLDFTYLDVFYGKGWTGWRMHSKINDLGILQYTEFPGVMERAVIWNHVANDWTQAKWGKGDRSQIARFIYYSDKDTFLHEPLLRGTNSDGFMGWHAERDMLQTIKSAFVVNLPTKYLQHFELVKQESNMALFNNGAKTIVDGDTSKLFGPDGQLINTCRYTGPKTRPVDNMTFIPWCPLTEKKIYHWNDNGGDSQWTLPKSWSSVQSAYLYKLTDLGRVFEKQLKVTGGKVTLSGIAAATPYVLYKELPAVLPEIQWSEGSLVADTGFDSHSFKYWKKCPKTKDVKFVNNPFGQTELVFGPDGGQVSQPVRGLEAGTTYAASVWTSITNGQPATITVQPYIPTLKKPAIDKETWKVISTSSGKGNAAIDGKLDSFWHTAAGKNLTKHPHEIVVDMGTPLTLDGFIQTARPDMHNGVIKDYRLELSHNGESWKTVIDKGTFSYDGCKSEVRFKKPEQARYLKLTALSEHKGGPWASVAELDVIGRPSADNKKQIAAVSKTVNSTVLTNFTDQSSKYMSNWHRIKVLFDVPVGVEAAEVVLTAGKGDPNSSVHFDDVRVVKSGRSKAPAGVKNVVLYEDFENVDEGWGPFMYGWRGPMNTHLSETNLPYTKDTISGEFSLKTRNEKHKGIIYRTVPAMLELKPNTKYRISFDYLCDTPDRFAFVAAGDTTGADEYASVDLTNGQWEKTKATMIFTTDDQSDWFIGLYKNSEDKGILVIDDLLVERVE